MTNHEACDIYLRKSKLLDKGAMELAKISDDRVKLIDIVDKEDSGRIIIPSFVTDIGIAAFGGCRLSEVVIDNKQEMKLIGAFEYMESTRLRIVLNNPNNIVDMNESFLNCDRLIEISIESKDKKSKTNKLRSLRGAFRGCKRLKHINLECIDTSNVTDMESTFSSCERLESIDLSNFNTEKVTNMAAMFWGCSSLKQLDLSSFNTENVERIDWMFYWCTNLEFIRHKFNTKSVKSVERIFGGCDNLDLGVIEEFRKFGNIG